MISPRRMTWRRSGVRTLSPQNCNHKKRMAHADPHFNRTFEVVTMLAVLSLASISCAGDAIPFDPIPSAIRIQQVPDTLLFDQSADARATMSNADGLPIERSGIQWSSSDPRVVAVGPTGRVLAVRPGSAFVRAQVGAARDSVLVTVPHTRCPRPRNDLTTNNWKMDYLVGGLAGSALHQSGLYLGQPVLSHVQMLFGTSSATAYQGMSFISTPSCMRRTAAGAEVFSDVGEVRPASNAIPGLRVTTEFYSFFAPNVDDFMLLRHAFTNSGIAPITNLSVGMELLSRGPGFVVTSFDPASGVVSQTWADSVAQSVVWGARMLNRTVGSFNVYPVSDPRLIYPRLTTGIIEAGRSPIDGVPILAAEPFTLAPGQTAVIWFALAGGPDRAAFEQHIEAAASSATFIEEHRN